MNADVLRAINGQINSEFTAWYQYLAMAAFCEREKFTGAARWLQAQSVEEYQHGMKLFNFVLARNGVVELIAIDQPAREFESESVSAWQQQTSPAANGFAPRLPVLETDQFRARQTLEALRLGIVPLQDVETLTIGLEEPSALKSACSRNCWSVPPPASLAIVQNE